MNLLVMLAKEILENFLLPRKQKNFFRNYLTELYNNISDTDINTIISKKVRILPLFYMNFCENEEYNRDTYNIFMLY